jgi:hypothetical protein
MKRLALMCAAMLAIGVSPALAQKPPSRALLRARETLRECILNGAAWAWARAEATPDTVADAAARKCEGPFIKAVVVTRHLMEPAQAKVEVNTLAYDYATRILSH